MYDIGVSFDVRDLLGAVAVPTLVLHSATNILIPTAQGRYLADHIPAARYFEVDEDVAFEWDSAGLGGEVSEFLTRSRAHAHVNRSLLVVLFTDIAGSTDRIAAVGDTVWRETLDSFRRLMRQVIDRYSAREVDTRGDDFFVVASSPSIAIRHRTGYPVGSGEHRSASTKSIGARRQRSRTGNTPFCCCGPIRGT